MTSSLFRTEAIEHRRRLRGEVMIVQPVSHGIMTAVLGFCVLIAAIYFVTGTYDRKETVQGYIAPTGGLAQVYATKGGSVTKVLAHEGAVVAQGQPLVELSLETAGVDGPVGEKIRRQAVSRIQAIDTQIGSAKARYDQEARRLAARSASLVEELSSQEARLSSERQLQVLQAEDMARYSQLQSKGNGTKFELSRLQQQALTQNGLVQELERQKESRNGDLGDVRSQIISLPAERDDKLAQLLGMRSELEQSLVQLEMTRSYTMVAPVAGTIAVSQAETGQTATPQSPLMALIPAGSNLEANLLLPPKSVGMIKPGQDVRLRIDAFPYQRFGAVRGRVTQVSHATYREGELLAPIAFKETIYRVTVSLDRASVHAYGEDRQLATGMTLVADVITDRRRFTDWVLDPLKAIAGRRQ